MTITKKQLAGIEKAVQPYDVVGTTFTYSVNADDVRDLVESYRKAVGMIDRAVHCKACENYHRTTTHTCEIQTAQDFIAAFNVTDDDE